MKYEKQIPLAKPSLGREELRALEEIFKTGWVTLGPKTQLFEREFARYVGARWAVGLNSCTAALHLSLVALGIDSGEVLVPSLSFISTCVAPLYVGARPVFVDVEEDTLNIDPGDVVNKITKKTHAIIMLHYGGHPCDIDLIKEIAKRKGLATIEDAAHSAGSEYKTRRIGSFSHVTSFSFHATKNLTTGDGGMVTTNDSKIVKHLIKLRGMGVDRDSWRRSKAALNSWSYRIEELGFKAYMNDIMAAIGLVQLRKLEELNKRRRQICKRYNEGLGGLEWLKTPVEKDYAKSNWHLYVIKTKERDRLSNFLKKRNIATSVHYMPNHLQPIFRGYRAFVPTAEKVWKKLLTLPLYPDMRNADVDRVIDCIREFGKKI